MTHSLSIKDNSGAELYDLLGSPDLFGSVLGIDLGTRQISPLDNGRWQETYQLFARSDNLATSISFFVFEIDEVCKQINDYGESPAYNSPIWLHEKSEGELAARRRAPLFSASQQPIVNGAVGPLLINNGYIGLLTIERGDWEALNITTVALPFSSYLSRFGFVSIASGGNVDGRFDELSVSIANSREPFVAVGIRPFRLGVANFQPCINLGSGLANGIGSNDPLVAAFQLTKDLATDTEPIGQLNTYTSVFFNLFDPVQNPTYVAPVVHKIRMNEVSGSTLDTINEHYVGDYDVYFRLYAATSIDKWFRIVFSYGFDGDMIENEAIYYNPSTDTATSTDYPFLNVGSMSLPGYIYRSGKGGVSDLSNFTFGIYIEMVSDGAVATRYRLTGDSLFLMPRNNVILDNIRPFTLGSLPTTTIYAEGDPSGAQYALSSGDPLSADVSIDMVIPSDGGVCVYLRESDYSTTSAASLELNYYIRYNSLT